MDLYYNRDVNSINEKRKLLEILTQRYLEIKKEKETRDPFSFFTECSNDNDLIDNLFEKFANGYDILNKRIFTSKEDGVIGLISNSQFESTYKRLKSANTDFETLTIHHFLLDDYKNFDYIRFGYTTKYFFDFLNELLNNEINKAKSDFLFLLSANESRSKIINSYLINLLTAFNKIKSSMKKSTKEFEKYFILIVEKAGNLLKEYVLEYFNIFSVSEKRKIKTTFPTLVNFLENEDSLCSFKVRNVKMENKLRFILMELKTIKLIEKIEFVQFLKIFSAEYIHNPINWLGTIGELYYFINLLEKKNFLELGLKNKWIKTAHCFNIQGKPIEAKKIRHQHNPSNTDKLDTIFKSY